MESIKGENFLLVLDDVWDDHRGRWLNRMSLLRAGAKKSRIIVTTRSYSVATVVDALETHTLDGLTENDSWNLFKRVAFAPGNETDPRRIELGREIVKKCANVPLAIRSIGSLLFEKNTIQEWESIRDDELPMLGRSHEDGIMPVLKLSYDHIPSNLKQCFAYCSLFPKDYEIFKKGLIYLWIAQGYVKQNTEDAGHSHFMHLLRRGFFQEVKKDKFGEIKSCKMHDLIHDLAQHVAGEESIMLTASSSTSDYSRHVSIGDFKIDESWAITTPLLNAKRLRSCLLLTGGSIGSSTLDQLFANFKWLRALSMPSLGIENVPDSIGELEHLRYLVLSSNKFETLPDSMTNLVNLLTLDINGCRKLKVLPDDLRKLINLRYLGIRFCDELKHMPGRIGEMSCLQYLSNFKVGRTSAIKEGIKQSGLDQLAGLQHQLKCYLSIEFDIDIDISDWDGDECWQLPVSPQELTIKYCPGRRIPHWGTNIDARANNLASLNLIYCVLVEYLPPLRCLPNLKSLHLCNLWELEYMEEDGDSYTTEVATGSSSFFPCLEELTLVDLRKLKGWWSEEATSSSVFLSFPRLSKLKIDGCPQLKSIPLCPHLTELELYNPDGNEVIEEVLSNTTPSSSSSFQQIFASPLLRNIDILECNALEILHLAPPKLKRLYTGSCQRLKILQILHPNDLEELLIRKCPELELWGSHDDKRCHLDWDSFSNLRRLQIDPLPPPEELPHCLRHRQSNGQLKITHLPW